MTCSVGGETDIGTVAGSYIDLAAALYIASFFLTIMALLHLLTVLIVLYLHPAISQTPPLTLIAHEGDRIYLPCFNRPEEIQAWSFLGSLYPAHELPSWVEETPNGLIIDQAVQSLSGTYTCFTYNQQSFTLQELSTVYFTVDTLPRSERPQVQGKAAGNTDTELSLRISQNDVVYIPCLTAENISQVDVWKLDDSTYPASELPPFHFALSGGIVLFGASAYTTGKKYECYWAVDDTLELLYTVNIEFLQPGNTQQQAGSMSQKPKFYRMPSIKMISRKTFLSITNKEFGFRLHNNLPNQNISTCMPGNVTFKYNVFNDTSVIPNWSSENKNGSVVIPSQQFSDPTTFFTTFTTNSTNLVCAKWDRKLRVKMNKTTDVKCVPEGGSSFITIPFNNPEYHDLTVAIWAKHQNSDDDCHCAVARPTAAASFNTCACFTKHQTNYDVVLKDDKLYFSNLTRNTNDTIVLLVHDHTLSREEDFSVERKLISVTRFAVQGPDPYPPNITQRSTDEVCIKSRSPEPWSPVVRTNITMFDITSDLLFGVNVLSDELCIQMGSFPKSCAPFTFNVTAFTQCTPSPLKTFQSSGNGNECECLQKKANFTFMVHEITDTSFTLLVNATCLQLPDIQISNLHIFAKRVGCSSPDCKFHLPFNISCNPGIQNVMVPNLESYSHYDLSIMWISPSQNKTQVCQVVNDQTYQTRFNVPLEIALIIAGVVLIVVASLCLFLVPCFCAKRKPSKSTDGETSPQGAYNKFHPYVST